jgi:hypothetical protein
MFFLLWFTLYPANRIYLRADADYFWYRANEEGWLRTGFLAPMCIEFYFLLLVAYCFFWGSIGQFFLISVVVLWTLELVVED